MTKPPAPPRRTPPRPTTPAEMTAQSDAAHALAQAGLVELPASPMPPPAPPPSESPSSWTAEVEQLPARLLRGLPVPTTLVCRSFDPRWPGEVALRGSRQAPVVEGLPDFAGLELDHLALAAEHDRAQLPAWCARKLAGAWVLSAAVATGQRDLGEVLVPLGWDIGRVLRRLAVRIERIELCP